MKHVNLEKGIPSAELKPGDVYRLVLPHRILPVVNVMKVISINSSLGTVTLMEMPFSKLHLTTQIKKVVFLEKWNPF